MSDADCTCAMLTSQTPWQPAEWEQAPDCPVHPLRPAAMDGECCASGRCEVCSPGFKW